MATTPGQSKGIVKSAHELTLVSSPTSGYRVVRWGFIQNHDTAITITVELRFYRSGTYHRMVIQLGPRAVWEYDGAMVFDTTEKLTAIVTSGSYTTPPDYFMSYLDQQ